VIFSAVMKTYVGTSGRRADTDLRVCKEQGLVGTHVHYNRIFETMNDPNLTPVLKELVRVSALPMSALESEFAIDGTAFSTQVYRRWYDAKYGKEMKESTWVKLHAVCGVRTNVIAAADVSEGTCHDSPFLPRLVQDISQGFTPTEISADKGYLGVENLRAIESVGAKPYIAFKQNSRPEGPEVWRRAYHMFALHNEEWLARYHKRSNVEATFSALKRKFGAAVRAKNLDAMKNEILLKCVAYNLSCVVHAMYELGIDPTFSRLGVAS